MDEKDMESALIAWGQERFRPPEELLQRISARRHHDPWLPWVLGLSLILQMITVSGGLLVWILFPMGWGLRLALFSLLMTLAMLPLGILAFPPPGKGLDPISFMIFKEEK